MRECVVIWSVCGDLYGGCVVERPPVYALQSHPEKSGPDGLRLLKNFVSLAP